MNDVLSSEDESEYGLGEIMPIDEIQDFDYSINFIENNLKENISVLPRDLQKKIYIYAFRKYWKEFVPITAKIPSWYNHKIYIENILYTARKNNIHFMHLPFNTLMKNKEWIMGCQCDFCKTENSICSIEKCCYSLIQYKDPSYFQSNMPHESVSYWNSNLLLKGNTIIKNFNPLCGSYREKKITKNLREGYIINFDDSYNYMTYNKPKLSFGKQAPIIKNTELFIFGQK